MNLTTKILWRLLDLPGNIVSVHVHKEAIKEERRIYLTQFKYYSTSKKL